MEDPKQEQLYLTEVELSGYKSIRSTKAKFQKGLNIIIGKNASGKTNFMEFLSKNLNCDFEGVFKFNSKLSFFDGRNIQVENEMDASVKDILKKRML
jgi:predicted ATP-dependent endonuclease of OLD family